MYLSRLFIKNYRSIRSLDVRFRKGKNVIVGKNNAGKSNIIRAIDLLLGESTPTYSKAENVTANDFYCWKEVEDGIEKTHSADELLIWCELSRDTGEPLNYEEMYKCFGFYVHTRIVEWNDRRPIKAPIRIDRFQLPQNCDSIFAIDEDNSTEKDYVNPKLKHQNTFEKLFEDKHLFAFAFRAKRLADGAICKEIRFLFREHKDADWIVSFKAPVRNELLQSAIMHSFRDPQTQLRLSSWTWYGKLIKHLTRTHEESPELQKAFAMVKEVSDEVFAEVRKQIETSSLKVAFPGTELHFQFNTDTQTELYRNCVIYVDDGYKSLLTEKGAGIQSATVIGLFNYYTRNVNAVTSSLLCLEEPEIYLHPHARRVVSDRLDGFLDGGKNQVILTTHSVEFIRGSSGDLNIVLVRKGEDGTTATQVDIGQFKSLLLDNNKNELFFADSVIACEGLDEYVIRAVADELFPCQLDEQNVSIVAVNGKDSLRKLTELVVKLGIDCFIVADFDYLLRDQSPEREKYQAVGHESVVDLGRRFFSQPRTFGTCGDEILERLRNLRQEIKTTNEKGFYTAKHVSELANRKAEKGIRFLRQHGICILPGEIEHLSKDAKLIAPAKKLSLSSVYTLNQRLSAGEKASDLFSIAELQEFLGVVFRRNAPRSNESIAVSAAAAGAGQQAEVVPS